LRTQLLEQFEAEAMLIKLLLISALVFAAVVSPPTALAQAPLPGCPGTTSAAQEQCIVAQELLDIANGVQMNDTSNQPAGGKTNSYQYCVNTRNSELQMLAKDWESAYKALKAKGDPNAALDAAKPLLTREANILSAYQRCMSRPLPLLPVPSTDSPLNPYH
jgi:hypothetical protein